MALNNKSLERKQAIIFPLVGKADQLDRRHSRQLERNKKIASTSQQKEIRKSGQLSMEQVIDLYKQKYERSAADNLTFLPNSPRFRKPRKSTMLELLSQGNTFQPKSLATNQVTSFNRGRIQPKKTQIKVENCKVLPSPVQQEAIVKNRRRELRKHLNLLIKKGSVNRRRYGCNTDVALNSPRNNQSEQIDCSLNESFEKLRRKLLQEQYINTHIVQSNYPSSSRQNLSHQNLNIELFHKVNHQQKEEEATEVVFTQSQMKKGKRYIDTTMEQLCKEDKSQFDEQNLDDFFLRVNTKAFSSRPPLPFISTALRQYKSKRPMKEGSNSIEGQIVSGWGQEDTDLQIKR